MKKIFTILGLLVLPFIAFAINVTVPTAPLGTVQYALQSTTTGAFITATTTAVNALTYNQVDINADINAAYAAGAASGTAVWIPTGQYLASTPLVAATQNKPLHLICASGGGATNIIYTGTGTSTTINTNYANGGNERNASEIDNCTFTGLNGTTASPAGLITGLSIGGSNGAFGFIGNNISISGFGTGLYYDSNVSFSTFTNTKIEHNGRNISIPQVSGANGENNRYNYGVVADSNDQADAVTDDKCIWNQLSGNTQLTFNGTSIDDCQYDSFQYGGTANTTNFIGTHFENPDGHVYDYVTTQANQPAVAINFIGGDLMNDYTSALPRFVDNGGAISFDGTAFDVNNNVNAPVTSVVVNQDANATDTVSWTGVTQKSANSGTASAVTNIYGSIPFSSQGYGTGIGLSYQIASSTGTHIGGLGLGGTPVIDQPLTAYSGGNNVFQIPNGGGVQVGLGTDIGAFNTDGDVLDLVQANSADENATMQNFSSGKGAFFSLTANSNYSAFTTSGTGSSWNFGEFGSTQFAVEDATDATSPFTIDKGAPTYSLVVKSTGNVAVGSSTPVANFQATTLSSNATSTVELGKAGQNKGTCIKLYRSDGSAIYASVQAGATTFSLSTSACATVSGF